MALGLRAQHTLHSLGLVMTAAFIVSAYHRPDLLLSTLQALDGRPVGLHIDQKSDAIDGARPELEALPNLSFLPRHRCDWGGFGHVAASLEGLRWARDQTTCSHAILMTGQCFPLVSMTRLDAELEMLGSRSILRSEAFPRRVWAHGGYDRFQNHHVFIRGRHHVLPLWRRRLPRGLTPHGGSSYWCLSRAAFCYVLDYLDAHKEVEKFFRTVFVPDEMFFQTILSSSNTGLQFYNENIHYIRFLPGAAHPDVLGMADIDEALNSGKWFTRKIASLAVMSELLAASSRP